MNINDVYILEERAILYVSGDDSEAFLQNLVSNDVKKVSKDRSCFDEETMNIIDNYLFKGSTHQKRGQGIQRINHNISRRIFELIQSKGYTLANVLHSDLVFIKNSFRD